MGNVKIEKSKMSIGEAKDVENALGNADKFQAFMDYVAACDYPEIFDIDDATQIDNLYAKGRLTEEEYRDIVGED